MKKYYFQDCQTADDVFSVILENDRYLNALDSNLISYHFSSYNKLEEEEKKRLLTFAKTVDKEFSPLGSSGYGRQKMLTVLTGISFLADCYEEVSSYTDPELTLLVSFSHFVPPEQYQDEIRRYPKDVLSSICCYDSNIMVQEDILYWYDEMLEHGFTKQELVNRIQDDTAKSLVDEAYQMEDDFVSRQFHM